MLTVMLAVSLMLTGCGKKQSAGELATGAKAVEKAEAAPEPVQEQEEEPERAVMPEILDEAWTGEGAVQSFIGEPFYEGVINNADDALNALYDVLAYMGGDHRTERGPGQIRTGAGVYRPGDPGGLLCASYRRGLGVLQRGRVKCNF